MPSGGRRNGAGRKPGTASQKTREVADRVAQGLTPLEVIIEAMNYYHGKGDIERAAFFAKDAAPYVHPRLQSTTLQGKVGVALEVVEEIVSVEDDPQDDSTAQGAT